MFTKASKTIAKLTRRFKLPFVIGIQMAFAFLLPGSSDIHAAELRMQDSHKQPVEDQHILTPEKFQDLIDQTVDLLSFDVTPQQALLINSNFKEPSYRYSTTETEFLRLLSDLHTIDIPKSQSFNNSYFLSFPGDYPGEYQGIVTTIGRDYDFSLNLKVLNDPKVGIQGISLKNGVTTKANIQYRTGLFDQKESFIDQVKKVAGEVKCTWNRTNTGTNLTVNSLSVFPYIIDETSKGPRVRIDELDTRNSAHPYDGIIAKDYEYRLNKIEVFLERFAFEIAKVNEIILKHKSVDSVALDILKKDNGQGIFFKKIEEGYPEGEEWYHLKESIGVQDENSSATEEENDNHSNLGRSAGSDDTEYSTSENCAFVQDDSY